MHFHVKSLARAGMIAAIYAALTLIFAPISFNAVQFRISEAMTVLPILLPEAVPGLAVGCLVANILGGAALPDVIGGTLATLIAAWLTSRCRSRYLAPLPPVVVNAVLVGGLLAFEQAGFTGAFAAAFWYNACSLAVSEAVVCYVLGLLLLKGLEKTKYFRDLQKKD